jgi:hypothetical protein
VFTNKATALSVDDIPYKPDHFLIYPNPAVNGQVTIEIEPSGYGSALKIYELYGRKVFETSLASSSTVLDVSSLKRGMYIVIVSNTSGTSTQKMVID